MNDKHVELWAARTRLELILETCNKVEPHDVPQTLLDMVQKTKDSIDAVMKMEGISIEDKT